MCIYICVAYVQTENLYLSRIFHEKKSSCTARLKSQERHPIVFFCCSYVPCCCSAQGVTQDYTFRFIRPKLFLVFFVRKGNQISVIIVPCVYIHLIIIITEQNEPATSDQKPFLSLQSPNYSVFYFKTAATIWQ